MNKMELNFFTLEPLTDIMREINTVVNVSKLSIINVYFTAAVDKYNLSEHLNNYAIDTYYEMYKICLYSKKDKIDIILDSAFEDNRLRTFFLNLIKKYIYLRTVDDICVAPSGDILILNNGTSIRDVEIFACRNLTNDVELMHNLFDPYIIYLVCEFLIKGITLIVYICSYISNTDWLTHTARIKVEYLRKLYNTHVTNTWPTCDKCFLKHSPKFKCYNEFEYDL